MNAKYLSILFALLAVSFSYANWGDALEIGVANDPNEVSTTEMDWDIIVSCSEYPTFKDYYLKQKCAPLEWGCILYYPESYGTTTGTYNAENMVVNINVKNAYPGYVFATDFCIKNTGNLPSKLKDIDVTYDNAVLAGYLKTSAKITYKTSPWAWSVTKYYTNKSLDDLATAIENDIAGIVFKPGGWICFGDEMTEEENANTNGGESEENTIYFFFPYCSNIPMNSNLNFSIKFNFVQFNQ